MRMDRYDFVFAPVYSVYNIWTNRAESVHLDMESAYLTRAAMHDDGRVALAARCILMPSPPNARQMRARAKAWDAAS